MRRIFSVLFLVLFFGGLQVFASGEILFPTANYKVCIGKTCNIRWDQNYFKTDGNGVIIILYKGNFKRIGVLVPSTNNDGSWEWNVPGNLQPGSDYRLFVKGFGADSAPEKFSSIFEIVDCSLRLARDRRDQPRSTLGTLPANVTERDNSKLTVIDICDSFMTSEFKFNLTRFTIRAADPYNRNSEAIGDITVVNTGSRCIQSLRWYLLNNQLGMIAIGIISPEDYGKSKWLLRAGESISAVFSIPGAQIWAFQESLSPSQCTPPFVMCNEVKLYVAPYTNPNTHSNTKEAVIKWAFAKE